MENMILQILKNNAMTESQITEKILNYKRYDICVFNLYDGQKRSCEVRATLSKLLRSKKISLIDGKFKLSSELCR